MLRRLATGLMLGLGIGSAAMAQSASDFDGQYTGELALTRTIDGDCTEPPLGSLYPLTISGGQVRFVYAPRFNTTLSGTIARNGVFKAAARIRKGTIRMTGRVDGGNVTATILSPSCNYTFRTHN